MADLALAACKLLALQVYEKARLAVANKEDCAQLARYISGLQPMMEELQHARIVSSGAAQQSLEHLRDTLQQALELITRCCSMGWMKALVKAGNVKGEFTRITLDLERALAALPMANLALSDQVQQGIVALQADLHSAKFQMLAMQEALVTEMRKQAERARLDDTRLDEMHEMMHKLISRAAGDSLKKSSREGLKREIEELRKEQELTRCEKDRQEEYFLEQIIIVLGGSMRLAARRDAAMSSGKENYLPDYPVLTPTPPTIKVPEGAAVPRQFLCPISREIMSDPVMLVETGKTYDRSYIEEWFDRGHRTCPATGQAVASCQLAPNIDFRSAIEAWVASATEEQGDGPQPTPPPRSTKWTPGSCKASLSTASKSISNADRVRGRPSSAPSRTRPVHSFTSGNIAVSAHFTVRQSTAPLPPPDSSRSSGSAFIPSPARAFSPYRSRSRTGITPASSTRSSTKSIPESLDGVSPAMLPQSRRANGDSCEVPTGVYQIEVSESEQGQSPSLTWISSNRSSAGSAPGPRWQFSQGSMQKLLRRVSGSSEQDDRTVSSCGVSISEESDLVADLVTSTTLSSTNSSLSSILSSTGHSQDSSLETENCVSGASAGATLIPAMICIIRDHQASPPEDRLMAMEVLRDIVSQSAPAEISRPMLRAQGVSALAKVMVETEAPFGLIAHGLAVLNTISADSSCMASILAEDIPEIASQLLKSDESDTAAAAAALVATLCRLGDSAAAAVNVDSVAMLALVRMLQDDSSLDARAAAGSAIQELMKGNRKNKLVIEKANGISLLVELLNLGVSDAVRSLDKKAYACIAVIATQALTGLAVDNTTNQACIGGTSGLMGYLVSLLTGVAGEHGQQASAELIHRLVARVDANRRAFMEEPKGKEALLELLKGHSERPMSDRLACDAALVVGILATAGAREEFAKLSAKEHLENLGSKPLIPPGVKAAVEFALQSL